DAETRFKCSHLRDYHRIHGGAGVTIRTQCGPFGVLLAYSNDAREFREYELAFLKSTANIVGEAMMRGRAESALRKSELRLRQLITAFIRDISERKRAHHELEQRERRFRTIFEKSWSGVALLDADLNFSFAGSSTQNVVGYDEFEMLGKSLLEYIHPRERSVAQ